MSQAQLQANKFGDLFIKTMKEKLDLYWQTSHVELPKSPKIELVDVTTVDLKSNKNSNKTEVVEFANWRNFANIEDEAKIRESVLELANEAAISVDSYLRVVAGKFGNHRDVRNITTIDVFDKNIAFNFVTNVPVSVIDPSGMIQGWIAYKFHFAAGFAA